MLLLEKNPAPGKKILITGKGRCNLTNDCSRDELLKNIPANPKFLYPAFQQFSVEDCLLFFNARGVRTKTERGGRVFPESDRAADIAGALQGYVRESGAVLRVNSQVTGLKSLGSAAARHNDPGKTGFMVTLADGGTLNARTVIIATGGLSAPGTGSTGDGYRWAEKFGHQVTPLLPSLVPLETAETWVKEVQGLTLKNVRTTLAAGGKAVSEEFGELLFTHFGVSGPIVLTLSDQAVQALAKGVGVELIIDLKSALDRDQLDRRLQRDFAEFARKQLKNALDNLLPKSLIPVIISLSGIPEDKFVHQLTRPERSKLAELLKGLRLKVVKARPIKEAVITAGGVNIKEVNPRTMESKLVSGLYFAGEILDVHGYTGGFNLQIAWSTGFVAGNSAADSILALPPS